MNRRPVGHVTELIGELLRWTRRREAKNLRSGPLRRSILYLTEYREMLAESGRAARARAIGTIRGTAATSPEA